MLQILILTVTKDFPMSSTDNKENSGNIANQNNKGKNIQNILKSPDHSNLNVKSIEKIPVKTSVVKSLVNSQVGIAAKETLEQRLMTQFQSGSRQVANQQNSTGINNNVRPGVLNSWINMKLISEGHNKGAASSIAPELTFKSSDDSLSNSLHSTAPKLTKKSTTAPSSAPILSPPSNPVIASKPSRLSVPLIASVVPTPAIVAPKIASVVPTPAIVAPKIASVVPTPAIVAPKITSVVPTPAIVAPKITSVVPTPAIVAPKIASVVPTPAIVALKITSEVQPTPVTSTTRTVTFEDGTNDYDEQDVSNTEDIDEDTSEDTSEDVTDDAISANYTPHQVQLISNLAKAEGSAGRLAYRLSHKLETSDVKTAVSM